MRALEYRLRMMLMLGLLLASSGCFYGPRGVQVTRLGYNTMLKQSAEEEMLLNIVRLKYRETPEFVGIPNVVERLTYSGSFGSTASFSPHRLTGWGLSGGVGFIESPTITYTPLQDEKFNHRLLSPISLEVLGVLTATGWNVSRVFRLISKNINDVDNATTAGGPTPEEAPEYVVFFEATHMIRELQKRRQMEITHEFISGPPSAKSDQSDDESDTDATDTADEVEAASPPTVDQIILRIAPEAVDSPEAKSLAELLSLQAGLEVIPIVDATSGQLKQRGKVHDRLHVSNRSFLEVLYFLSQGISIPDEHYEKGLVTVTRHPDGSYFDWTDVTGNLLRVEVSECRPEDASVTVEYRGYWYYIRDSDLNSKSTFNLLLELYNIAIRGGAVGGAPVLTQSV
jgi:hypothetical protein